MKTITLALILLSTPILSAAEPIPPENLRLATELCEVMKIDGGFDAVIDQMQDMRTRMGVPSGEGQDTAIRDFMAAAQKKAHPLLVEIYATNFTKEDLEGMLAFFKSPVGQKWIERQPAVQQQIMDRMQDIVLEMQPELMKSLMKGLPGVPKSE